MRWLLVLLLLCWPAQAAVVLDASSTDVKGANVTSITNSNQTVGSGANRALVATIMWSTQITAESCTWDNGGTNQAMTEIVSINNPASANGRAAIFVLVAPTSGNKQLSCSWTSSSADVFVAMSSYTGANQTGGTTTFYNAGSNSGSGSPGSITIASVVGDATVDGIHVGDSTCTLTGPSQTQIFEDSGGSISCAGSSRASGAGSVAFSWTMTGSPDHWVEVAVAIKAANTCPRTLGSLGVGC